MSNEDEEERLQDFSENHFLELLEVFIEKHPEEWSLFIEETFDRHLEDNEIAYDDEIHNYYICWFNEQSSDLEDSFVDTYMEEWEEFVFEMWEISEQGAYDD